MIFQCSHNIMFEIKNGKKNQIDALHIVKSNYVIFCETPCNSVYTTRVRNQRFVRDYFRYSFIVMNTSRWRLTGDPCPRNDRIYHDIIIYIYTHLCSNIFTWPDHEYSKPSCANDGTVASRKYFEYIYRFVDYTM